MALNAAFRTLKRNSTLLSNSSTLINQVIQQNSRLAFRICINVVLASEAHVPNLTLPQVQQRFAATHAENTNTFIKEVRGFSLLQVHLIINTEPGLPLPAAEHSLSVIQSLQALSALEYPEKLQRLLLTPQREVVVELVITKDDGEIETFNAYRHDGCLSFGPAVDSF